MTGYTVLAGALIFFLLFIYATWFGTQLKLEKQEDKVPSIKINPYDNMSLSRRFIDKKNKQIGIFDLGNHILIIGMVLLVIFVPEGATAPWGYAQRPTAWKPKSNTLFLTVLLFWNELNLIPDL